MATMGIGRIVSWWHWAAGAAAALVLMAAGPACSESEEPAASAAQMLGKEGAVFTKVEYPRTVMFWAGGRDEWSPKAFARHDLIVVSPGQLGMRPDREPSGLADGFAAESVQAGKERLAEIRQLNPDAVVLLAIGFYEYGDDSLPEDHTWWLRVDGKREQFWPGTHRMDWYNAEYRSHVVRQSAAAMEIGADGLFYDNLREEPEPWIAFLGAVREAVGDDCLLMANTGYAISEYDFAAPYLNGFMYESGWSHRRTEWDECIEAMRHTATLLRAPRISAIERFEEIRSHAGWPTDGKHGQRPPLDPPARRWSMCYALIIGNYHYLFSDSTSHQHDWYPEYDVKIGLPAGEGERLSSHVWRREYGKALVVMNLPGAAEAHEVELERSARDSFTGETGTRFSIPPGDGRVLVWEG